MKYQEKLDKTCEAHLCSHRS